jgi:3-hydroxyacyl-[acyl-carrier-protein] dehydratase
LPILEVEEIRVILPHRYPFLLVDRILDFEPGKHATGIKNVTVNEQFFQGHFPQKAIMPGVLIVEAMAQVGGVMLLTSETYKNKKAYLATIESAKFRRTVVPGDQLITEVLLLRTRGQMGKVQCTARVGDHVVAEAVLMFAMVDAF